MLRETVDKETIDFIMLRIKEPSETTHLRNCRQIPLTLNFRLKELLGAMFLYFLQTVHEFYTFLYFVYTFLYVLYFRLHPVHFLSRSSKL